MATDEATPKKEVKRELSLLREARDLLKVARPGMRTDFLREALVRFEEANDIFKTSCTRSAMRNLVGSATLLIRAVDAMTIEGDNPPRSGAGETPRVEQALDKKAACG